ncbi:MAG: hypothetical protein QGG40_05010, partial [Myxococcota bacterium]|nr:hypothetical protein [Myxococcota bacterium]
MQEPWLFSRTRGRLIGLTIVLVGPGCMYLEEQRSIPTEITWDGYVLAGTPTDDLTALEEGSVTFLGVDGSTLSEAEQPYTSYPGYWSAEVPVDTELFVRIDGTDLAPTLMHGFSPTGRASWYTGALFGRTAAEVESLFESLSDAALVDFEPLSEGEVAYLWGEPLYPETWTGADITLEGGDDELIEIWKFAIDDEGQLEDAGEGPIDLFLAADITPGTVRMTVDTLAGNQVVDLLPLRELSRLSTINLTNNEVRDLSPLLEMTNLKSVWV